MDAKFLKMMNEIQRVKHELTEKHRPSIINGIKTMNKTEQQQTQDDRPKAFKTLMNQQRKLMSKKTQSKTTPIKTQSKTTPIKVEPNLTFRPATTNETLTDKEFNKPWNKLITSSKIQALNKFIETLEQHLTIDQVGQLRFLLIASSNERNLGSVSYDVGKGIILKINRLVIDNEKFTLLGQDEPNRAIGLDSFKSTAPTPPPNEIVAQVKPSLPLKKIVIKPRITLKQ